jgi:ABC-type transport system involved in multi-copper enzyme maturation permease subunit
VYLWKCWRDTRSGVYIYLSLLIFFAALRVIWLYRAYGIGHISGDAAQLWEEALVTMFILSHLCATIMAFANGTINAGADIGNGTGDFLLTRPCSRRYVVWVGWAVGFAEVIGLASITVLVALGILTLAEGPVWRSVPPATRLEVMQMNVALLVATLLLTAAVIYGLTYFLTILLRSGKLGLLTSLIVVFGYLVAKLLAQWAHIELPLTPHVKIIGWTILALAFPFASQIVLDRGDV